jgi:hypothetical protein
MDRGKRSSLMGQPRMWAIGSHFFCPKVFRKISRIHVGRVK